MLDCVPRSAKGKRSIRKKFEDNPMHRFDLLATVAGKLLTEEEDSSTLVNITGPPNLKDSKNVKNEQVDVSNLFESEDSVRISCDDSVLGPDHIFKKELHPTKEAASAPDFPILYPNKLGKESVLTSIKGDGDKEPLQITQDDVVKIGPDMYNAVDPMDMDVKPPPLVSSVPPHEKGVELVVDRESHKSFSGCKFPTIVTNNYHRPHHIGDHRIRKLLASKIRKQAPKRIYKEELSNTEIKSAFYSKKVCYARQRTRKTTMFKRRNLFEHCSVSPFGRQVCNQGTSKGPAKGTIKFEESDSLSASHGASVALSSMIVQNSSSSQDYHVKLNIKSFKVPELFIEVPETATVGSLKRTIMEAVTAVLGNGLHVSVLLQGKKVRDDNKTLRQAGISCGNKLDDLGFSLEPKSSQAPFQLTVRGDSERLARIQPTATPFRQPIVTFSSNCPESDHDSVHSPTNALSVNKTPSSSQMLVPVPSMDLLDLVPRRKLRQSELSQRRIRRPFSVAEVEALVEAVEKLGTGRWRDVKLRAFDKAKHRTYVDLKDKWKTLVHTASISPQQRRGEPVPQELLDRVLSAQAYWSQ
ncbi:telomere repeat-binding protein 5 [Ananas comosus]|uniref:Telomere repeat-binding protein 5 n=1 Tax=Ananas comosus TaxID=4615 RepID=A0A6P5GBR9_ANACO|nr:telomere repeat-binding protein 5 [Ananas comosus]